MKILALAVALLLCIFTSISSAVTVTIYLDGVPKDYMLSSMQTDVNGAITLNVTSTTPPPPGALALGLSPSSLPNGTQGIAYSQSVTMSASGGTGQYTKFECSNSPTTAVVGITATANGSTCAVSGTANATGTHTVNFTVTDSGNATASRSIAFSVSATTPPPTTGDCVTLVKGDYLSADIRGNDAQTYCFLLDGPNLSVAIFTNDWATNQDMLVSTAPLTWTNYNTIVKPKLLTTSFPTIRAGSPPWYKISPTNSESLNLYAMDGYVGQKIYVTIFNVSSSMGKYKIGWNAY